MKIFTHNYNEHSWTGPNKFTKQLFNNMKRNFNVMIVNNQREADVEFCLIQQQVHKVKPMVLRLDGIWFNSEQDYKTQNGPIEFSYENSNAVIYQSHFNKSLTEHWFGKHKNSYVIHNVADSELIKKIPVFNEPKLDKFSEIWVSASSWRPHKRLRDNILYFIENAPKDAGMVIAGKVENINIFAEFNDNRLMYTGELSWESLISLCKRASTFVHLAYLDHCPNVVVDAQACGCKIICSSTGGTSEIVSKGIIINEDKWDFKPIALYKPPKMNFDNCIEVSLSKDEQMELCSTKYFNILESIM